MGGIFKTTFKSTKLLNLLSTNARILCNTLALLHIDMTPCANVRE
ncbi:hypothetical protein BN1002_03568 [Bacillus sp. B-jedd]|nr:hypothetical protein BN1002_03568 [Bacillus sp. B-jedd]